MDKFENFLILVSLLLIGYTVVAGCSETAQGGALVLLLVGIMLKYIANENEKELKRAKKMGEAWKRQDKNTNNDK